MSYNHIANRLVICTFVSQQDKIESKNVSFTRFLSKDEPKKKEQNQFYLC